MQRRDFLATTTALGLASLVPTVDGAESAAESDSKQRYILLEIFFTRSTAKRDALVAKFDEKLIPLRNQIGFDKVGVFTVNQDLMKDEGGYRADLYDSAVFVVQECDSVELLLEYQERSAAVGSFFNLEDDLDFVDEEVIALKAVSGQPRLEVPYDNPERIIQLRTYNSPNYDRNAAKISMFNNGELELFRNSGMLPVFMGGALFGSWAPNLTYMLSFPNDEARSEGWKKFVTSPGWKKLSSDPTYARTATRIRNLFLKPSPKSQI